MRVRVAVDGVDFSHLTHVESLTVTQDSTQAVSTAQLRLMRAGTGAAAAARYDQARYDDAARYAWSVAEWQELRIWDEDTGQLLFGGFILGVVSEPEGPHVWLTLNCTDYGILLDRRLITQSWPDGTPDSTIFADALRVAPELRAGDLVTQINSLGLIEAKDQRVRDLYDQVCQLTGGEWHVSYDGAVNYYRQGSIVAPFALTDVNPDGVATVGFSVESNSRDFTQGANRVLVLGQVTADGEISALAEDLASQEQFGVLSVAIPQRQITDQATADLLARSTVSERAWPAPTLTVAVTDPGLARGMTVQVTSVRLGIAAALILRTLTIVIIAPDRDRAPAAGHVLKYAATLGSRPPDTVYELRRMQRRIEPTTPPVATIPPGSIDGDDFADGWGPIQAVDVLPPLPDPKFSDTAVVFLTTDRQLYRRTGNSWTNYINAPAITGQLQTTQLAPGSVTSVVLADGSVVTAKIPADQITAVQIAPGAVTTTELADGSVVTAKIPAGAITAPQIAASAVTANAIAANAVYAGAIQAGAITADKIAAGAVTANAIAANSIAAIHIQANAIETQHLIANAVTTGKIAALAITSDQLAANSVIAGKIAANAVTAVTIAADAVTAGKIAADAVTATTIAAGSVSSDKLNATEIAVGYGGAKPGRLAVYSTAGLVAVLGDFYDGVNYGGWFKLFGAGGTGYGDAKIRSNAAGDLGIFNAELAITRGTDTIRMGPSVVNPWTTRLSILMDNGATQKSVLSPRALSIYGQWSPGGEPSIQLGLSEYEDAFLTLNGSNLNTYIYLKGQSGSISCSGSIEVNGHVLMGFTGGTSGVTYTIENFGYVINSAGAFVGSGINTAGGIISKGQTQVWAQAICVMNAAGNQYLGYIQADGSFYSVKGITLAGGIICGGQAGLGDPATTGAFPVDVTTPSGQKTLWFMGGILYAVT